MLDAYFAVLNATFTYVTVHHEMSRKGDRPPRNESEVPSGCLELEWKMGVGGVKILAKY